ncbi:hypothetical protein V2J09_001426 [Rumex salicifolius]
MSTASTDSNRKIVVCDCEIQAIINTTYSEQNYGRRFYSYPNYDRDEDQFCGFFMWIDTPFDRHTSNVIRKLTQRQKDLQEQNIELAKKLQAKDEKLLQTKAPANLNSFIILGVVMIIMNVGHVVMKMYGVVMQLLNTAYTEQNYGRRFYGYPNYVRDGH